MTIIYQYRVATTSLGGFLRLLTIWRGSVYKLMYKEILIFSSMYAAISVTYRVGLNEKQRHMFERLVIHCSSYTNLIPISFVLGFYVSIVVARWWQQFINVPWPDRTLFMTVTYLHGNDERARMFRRTLARYMILGLILICRSISVAVMKRFPTMEHVIDAGFMTKEEVEIWEGVRCKYHKFWVPLTWANNMLVTARREGRIESDWGMRMIIQQLADFRDKCSLLFVYDWITIPLVYTQVVTLAVYTFFAACLVARQYLDPNRGYEGFGYDLYVPVFTLLQFFFYMGWLKVAEQLINPFGEDDDDYDINWLLDRHTAVSMALIDQCYGKHPPLIRDMYWNENVEELPYTEASYASKRPNFLGSTYNIAKPSIEEQRIVNDLGEAPTRRSSVSSTVAGSLLSLFSRRHSMTKLHQQPECLIFPKREDRAMSVPNGGPQLLGIPGLPGMNPPDLRSTRLDTPNIVTNWSSDSDLATRTTEDTIERRRRAHTDIEGRGDLGREKVRPHRKFSFPSALGRKRDARSSLSGTETPPPVTSQQLNAEPKQTRFMIEPVSGESGEGMSMARRNSKKMENMFSSIDKMQYTKNVSRPPLLSAIEEQNTVTSLSQLMQQQQHEAEMQNAMDMDDQDGTLPSLAEPEIFDEEALALFDEPRLDDIPTIRITEH